MNNVQRAPTGGAGAKPLLASAIIVGLGYRVRLGLVRLGLVRLGLVMLGLVRLGLVSLG